MRLVDGFIFYNEFQILNYRLHLLFDVVDAFIVVEATHTFMGTPKPLFFKENSHLFEKFKSKIVHVVVDNVPHLPPNVEKGEQWNNENHQRNSIQLGLQHLALEGNDLIMITDVDEIPGPRTLTRIKSGGMIPFSILRMDLYYYNLCTRFETKWYHPKIISYQEYTRCGKSCSELRLTATSEVIQDGGWHLSYFGSPLFIQNKTKAFSHQEFNNEENTDLSVIQQRIQKGTDIYNRASNRIAHVPIQENTYLPLGYELFFFSYAIPNVIS